MTTAQAPPRTKRRGRWVALALLLLVVLLGASAYLLREQLRDELALRQYRRAVASDDPAREQHREQLLDRMFRKEDNFDLAARLADDTDPKVRAVAVELLLAHQPRAKKQGASEGVQAGARSGAWQKAVHDALLRLIKDPDDAVRLQALRGVSELDWAESFGGQLTEAVKTGSPAERLAIAEHLAHWNGPLLYQVVGDANQPAEVRAAALRGIETYGNRALAPWGDAFRKALESALKSENLELRRSAITALRHAKLSAAAWFDVLCDDKQQELHALALRTWIDVLGTATGAHWSDTHEVWFHTPTDARQCGIVTYVLCEGARLHMKQLDGTPEIGDMAAMRDRLGPTGPAFDLQLRKLGNILSVLSATRWYCETVEKPPELVVWLPHETATGAPPKRNMKAVVFQQAKPIWEWCLSNKDGYQTRFLAANSLVRCYVRTPPPFPIPVRPLGAVMDEVLVGPAEFDRFRARYDKK
jgi:hypothetical protein